MSDVIVGNDKIQTIFGPMDVVKAGLVALFDKVAVARRSAAGARRMADALVVDGADTYKAAAEDLQIISGKRAKLEEARLEITRPFDAVKAAIKGEADGPVSDFDYAIATTKAKLQAFDDGIAKALAEAARKADADAEAARFAIATEVADLRSRAAVSEPGVKAALEAKAEALQSVAAVTVSQPAAEPAKVSGISSRRHDDYEVTDFAAYVRFVANERPDLMSTLILDSIKMRVIVRALGAAAGLPGIKVFQKTTIAARKK